MARSTFVYVTYIRTTPEKLWSALTDMDYMKQYWFGMRCESQWTPGSSWKLVFGDDQILDTGEIVEAEPPRRLVIRWQHQSKPKLKRRRRVRNARWNWNPAERRSKLSITHTIEREPSKLIAAVSGGLAEDHLQPGSPLLETGSIVLGDPYPSGNPR